LPSPEGGPALVRWLRRALESAAAVPHAPTPPGTEWALILVSVAVAVAGIAGAFNAYLVRPGLATSLHERLAGLYRMLVHKYWVDEVYDAVLVRPFVAASEWLWGLWGAEGGGGLGNGGGLTLPAGARGAEPGP